MVMGLVKKNPRGAYGAKGQNNAAARKAAHPTAENPNSRV
jgi:hypothetical protein